ncbi:MAG: GTPase Era [Eubacterium sp.]|nr:GTPase Era [Eubacterium sp.]
MGKTFKSGFVSIVGRPNVGKSTLMNMIIGQKIAIMSSKAQTTRNKIKTVYTEDDKGQIVFLDTPGINKAKNKLGDFMLEEAMGSMEEADVILWLVEPTTYIGKGEQSIAEKLGKKDVPVILVINKIDAFTPEDLAKAIDAYKDILDFIDIVPVSALRNKNRELLVDIIFRNLPEGPMYYDPETVTDETEREIVKELIREAALHKLDKEVPHGIAVVIDTMKVRPDGRIVDIEATIICERDSHKGIIIGKHGAMLKNIGTGARIEIEKLLEMKVNLKLWVKVRRDWRENLGDLKDYGYTR